MRMITRLARGLRHGFDRASIREPLATLGDDVHHRVPRDLHFVTRCRLLAGAALGYPVDGTPRWNLRPPVDVPSIPARPYVVILHSTSRAEKLWPEADWRALVLHCERAGYASVVPWGSAEERGAQPSARPGLRRRDGATMAHRAASGGAAVPGCPRGRRGHRLHPSGRSAAHADARALHRDRPPAPRCGLRRRARARPGRRGIPAVARRRACAADQLLRMAPD